MKYKNDLKNASKEFFDGFKKIIKDLKNKQTRHKQIPNLLTLSRVLIAVFIPPAAFSGNLVLASVLTVIAASTDGLDGFMARKLNATSEFGKNLDPVCDKIFASILIIPLMIKLSPFTLFLGFNLVLESFIAGINLKSKIKGNVPRTTILGKIKTALLSVLLASLYISFSHEFNPLFIPITYMITITTQTLTCLNYYHIDKKKDSLNIKYKSLKEDEANIKEYEVNEEVLNKEKDKNKVNISIDDLKRLKEEIINTNNIQNEIKEKDFQKVKR